MMRNVHMILSTAAVSVTLMTGCGGSGSSSETEKATAIFKDSPVQGMSYSCSPSGLSGQTDSQGKLTCEAGDQATFRLGAASFGPVDIRENDTITPYRIFPNNNDAALNLAQLLQSLDDDGSYDNVINLSAVKLEAIDEALDFEAANFDTVANQMLTEHNVSLTLISEEDAQDHLKESVADTDKPLVTLKGEATVEVLLGATYTDAGATANDLVHGMMVPVMSGTVDTSTVGTYTITWTATDAAGNVGTAERTVKVVEGPDEEKPVVTLEGNTTVTITVDSTYEDAGATAHDNRDGEITPVMTSNVNTSVIGTYTVTWTATDAAGNVGTATRTVIVEAGPDTEAPVVTLNGDANVTLTVGDTYVEAGATAEDNVDGDVDVEVTGTVDTDTVGTYTLTYTATDTAGNIGSAERTVVVQEAPVDAVAPVVTLNGESTVTLTVGDSYTDAGATATDDVDGTLTPVMSGTVDTNTAGTYTVTWSATDTAGNTGTAIRTVVVEEKACENVNPITGECEDEEEKTCENVNPITGECEDEEEKACENVNPITGACEDEEEKPCQNVNPITGTCED